MKFRLSLLVCALAVSALPASADHQVGHLPPASAAASHFPSDFVAPTDSEWGFPLGGFGDTTSQRTARDPVIFVHGNNTDHATWFNVATQLTQPQLGWGKGDLWALSYNGVGCTNDGALFFPNTGYNGYTYQQDRATSTSCVITSNQINVDDLYNFVESVRAFTGAAKVDIVSHSLGVTLARKMLLDKNYYANVDAFVGIAGGNHGTSFCPAGSEGILNSCDEIAANTPWLNALNADETPGEVRYMTVYDSSGVADPAFLATYAESPILNGATNCRYPGQYHNDLRVNPSIVSAYGAFLQGASTAC